MMEEIHRNRPRDWGQSPTVHDSIAVVATMDCKKSSFFAKKIAFRG
jgi:hypothetical protein